MNRGKTIMKSKTIIGVLAILAIVIGLIIIAFNTIINGQGGTPTSSLTKSVTITDTPSITWTTTPHASRTASATITFSPTFSPSVTHTPTSTPTSTFPVVCTPPVCAIGTNETYFCQGECPSGCGTTCATYTPTK
jgi:hypothetical protein